MEQSSSRPGASLLPDTTDLFTAGHLALIAVLIVLVLLGLVAGIRRAAARRQAAKEVAEHNRAVEAEAPAAPPQADPVVPKRPSDTATELPQPDERNTSDAPIEAAVPVPVPAQPPPAPAGPSPADGSVSQLKGLGPKLATRLEEQGITTVGQIAALTDDEALALDARLGPFAGRLTRDRWLEQARFLAAGDRAGFEAVFGKL